MQVKAAALNRRDILVRTREQYRAAMPFTPSSDGAGVIAEVGQGQVMSALGTRW
jgi:NADPH:quinone reductase-like Zn-dependent oxidoreductase